jgi:hypothetical protein
MRRRYSIWVREFMSDHDVELLDVNTNPESVAEALRLKRVKIGKRGQTTARYVDVRVVDNEVQ